MKGSYDPFPPPSLIYTMGTKKKIFMLLGLAFLLSMMAALAIQIR